MSDWVTFDCYGTLADWLGGMRNALTPHVGAEDAERLLPALAQLRENGWSLAILSNCDDDLLATTLERMPVSFDLTVTAEQVGSYKPAAGHWEAFAQRTEGERGRWVHTAQSWFHDIQPASELGLPRVWIDRLDSGEDAALATVRLTDLRSLPQAVEQASASAGAS
jgi:2-haloacid dehalogenase